MKNFFFIFVAAFVAATACRNEGLRIAEAVESAGDEILFKVSGLDIDVNTRVDAVTSISSFYAAASTGTMGTGDSYVWTSTEFKQSNDVFTGGKYWPDEDKGYHFYASNVSLECTDNASPTVTVSGITKDIVCAVSPSPKHKTTTTLTFDHIFARLGSVSVNGPGDGYALNAVSIKITPKTKGKYNLFTGNGKTDASGWTVTGSSAETEIASSNGQQKENDIFLIPGSYTLTAVYTLSKGDFSREYTKTKDVSLEKGKVNDLTAYIPKPGSDDGAQEIMFTVTVTEWKDCATDVKF